MLRSLWRREVRLAWRGLRLIAMALGLASGSHGQGGATVRREIRAVRLSPPPVIDGDLSDPCWKQAVRADRFTDVLYGTPVADQTAVFLGYDARNIYVAFHAYDSQPRSIVARQTKRGVFPRGDDFVAITIDPFHTHKSAYRSRFVVNPLAAQFAQLGGGRGTKLEWEGKWQAAARITAEGWTAEMAIPWSILNYPAVRGPITCGINFDRFQQRTQTHSFLTPGVTWRFGAKLTLGVASCILHHQGDQQQHILTFNLDFSPRHGIAGRIVAETDGTDGYLSYRRSGYGGVETFLILGDPSARRFRQRLSLKVVWPI